MATAVLALVSAAGGSVETNGASYSVGFGVLYVVGFAMSVLGSVLVTRIRSVP